MLLSHVLTLTPVKKLLFTYAVSFCVFLFAALVVPTGSKPEGVILFLPVGFLLVFIFTTRRMIEGFILASLLMFMMLEKTPLGTINLLVENIYKTLSDDSYQWILLMSSAIGGFTLLLNASGSGHALTSWLLQRIKGKRSSLIWSWCFAALIFIDDFLHCMIIGPTMLPIAKDKKISKEMLTYILKSTGVALGAIIPLSVWSFFIIEQLEKSHLAGEGEGMQYFLHLIPLNFFAWISVLVSLLVATGIIPLFGAMKRAEERAEQGIFSSSGGQDEDEVVSGKPPRLFNVVVPLVVLLAFIIILDFDSVTAAIITLLFTFVLYISQQLITPQQFEDVFLSGGVKELAFLFVVILLSMVFSAGLETMGFVTYMIELVHHSHVPPMLFPLLLFVVFSLTEFAIGLSWSLFIITFPMITPMAMTLGADPMLSVAAIISATIVGVNCGFVSDMTILSCTFTDTDPMDHTIANLPYQGIAFFLSAVAFLIAGILMT